PRHVMLRFADVGGEKRLPFPQVETSGSMSNGQSGGPVLDCKKVAVIGINSRSVGEEADYSVVSWLGRTLRGSGRRPSSHKTKQLARGGRSSSRKRGKKTRSRR